MLAGVGAGADLAARGGLLTDGAAMPAVTPVEPTLLVDDGHGFRGAADLVAAGCQLVTITQYLRPSKRHHPVERWVKPEEFVELKDEADEVGFAGVMSGPLVRSSYRAGRLYQLAIESGRGSAAIRTAP